MTLIGFNFTKILAEKTGAPKGPLKVNRKCTPTAAEIRSIGGEKKAVRYNFEFSVSYEPSAAKIEFEGTMTELLKSEKEAQAIVDGWSKQSTLPPKDVERIMTYILNRCHIEAMIMAKELNVPSPIRLPSVKVSETTPKKAEETEEKAE